MKKIGVLVANGSKAKFIAYHDNHHPIPNEIEVVEEFFHPESRLKRSELAFDKPGHYKANSHARGAYGEDYDPKQDAKEQFAIELAKKLNLYRTQQGFNQFIFIAPTQFVGLLEKHFPKKNGFIVSELHKDYTEYTNAQLLPIVEAELHPYKKQ